MKGRRKQTGKEEKKIERSKEKEKVKGSEEK